MTLYFSPTAAARESLRRRIALADGLRHGGLDQVRAALEAPAKADPPAYAATARHLGWDDRVDAEQAWFDAGQAGDVTDFDTYQREGDTRAQP